MGGHRELNSELLERAPMAGYVTKNEGGVPYFSITVGPFSSEEMAAYGLQSTLFCLGTEAIDTAARELADSKGNHKAVSEYWDADKMKSAKPLPLTLEGEQLPLDLKGSGSEQQ